MLPPNRHMKEVIGMKIEVGKKYELNNGDVRVCTGMHYADPLHVDSSGFGPFVIGYCLYHQDGRFGDKGHDHALSVKRCVSDRDQELTSPYGDGNHQLPDTPKTWGEMTDAEKGALLLDWNDNHARNVQQWNGSEWIGMATGRFGRVTAYRIKREPKRETEIYEWNTAYGFYGTDGDDDPKTTHRITFDTIDGEPDLDSIKMERV